MGKTSGVASAVTGGGVQKAKVKQNQKAAVVEKGKTKTPAKEESEEEESDEDDEEESEESDDEDDDEDDDEESEDDDEKDEKDEDDEKDEKDEEKTLASSSSSSSAKDDPTTVFVSGLSYEATEEDVRSFFNPCGTVREVRMPRFQDSGKPMGYAHVEFGSALEAAHACKLSKKSLKGRYLDVSMARDKNSKQFSSTQLSSVSSPPPQPKT